MTKSLLFTPVLIAASMILLMGFAIRSSFGLFQIPIATEFGWPRADFSLAIAIQNLAWGVGQPIFGAIAERFGDRRAIIAGDITGNYTAVWWVGIGVGALSAILHLPIKERSLTAQPA